MKTQTQIQDAGKTEVLKALTKAPKPCERDLRVNYTDKELLEIGKKLAESNRDHAAAEDEKKAVTSQLKARCDSIQGRIDEYSGQLTSGYTFRKVACEIRYDTPKRGMKQVVRLDTMEIVETAALSMSELQEELPLKEESQDNVEQFPGAETEVIVDKLTPDSWDDLDVSELVGGDADDMVVEEYIRNLRQLFVDSDEEMRPEASTRDALKTFIETTEPTSYVQGFIQWIADFGAKAPGGEIIGKYIADLSKPKVDGDFVRTNCTRLFLDGKTLTEIATVVGVTEAVVRENLQHAGLVKKNKGRKAATNHGTVSVPSDEGSRDDMGADSKNNL